MTIQAHRYHDISCGHRVCGHESKCAHLHGHNYRVHFTIVPSVALDGLGRVLDFSVMKTSLCEWLELTWDHRFLIWERDPWRVALLEVDKLGVCVVPFNPTAENMADHLLRVIAPKRLAGYPVVCTEVRIEETMRCHATAKL